MILEETNVMQGFLISTVNGRPWGFGDRDLRVEGLERAWGFGWVGWGFLPQ